MQKEETTENAPNVEETESTTPPWAPPIEPSVAPPADIAGKAKQYRVKLDVTFGTHPQKGRVPVLYLPTGEIKPNGSPRRKEFFCGDLIDVPVTDEHIRYLIGADLIEEVMS